MKHIAGIQEQREFAFRHRDAFIHRIIQAVIRLANIT